MDKKEKIVIEQWRKAVKETGFFEFFKFCQDHLKLSDRVITLICISIYSEWDDLSQKTLHLKEKGSIFWRHAEKYKPTEDIRSFRNGQIGIAVSCLLSRRSSLSKVCENIILDAGGFGHAFHSNWKTNTAITLAQQIYENMNFSTMPILADALQDADCGDEIILSRMRDTTRIHYRGNWIVDKLLGKRY